MPRAISGVTTHHDREVGGHDVVVAVHRSDGDGVLGATLAVPVLGRLGAVVLLPVTRWAIITSAFRAIVGVLVDDQHHVAHGLGIAFEYLPP